MKKNYIFLLGLELLASIMLFWAAFASHPYGFYQFLRILICAVGFYNAYYFYQREKRNWFIVYLVIGILFNPIILITFKKDTWQFIDFAVAIIFLVSFISLWRERNKNIFI